MALRIESIKFSAAGLLSDLRLEGLSNFDLIVITGPNGAGKSELLRPLREAHPHGIVTCKADGSGPDLTFKPAGGMQHRLDFITSVNLMENFRDLTQALALASNTTRLLEEARLLAQLSKKLGEADADSVNAEPPLLRGLREAYIESDRAVRGAPRTLAEYDRLGRALASRQQVAWQRADLQAEPKCRQDAENAVRPQSRFLTGLNDLLLSLGKMVRLSVPDADGPGALGRLAAARSKAERLLDLARELVPSITAGGSGAAWSDTCREATDSLANAAQKLRDFMAARDHLRQCRTSALRFLQEEGAAGRSPVVCPVCDQSADSHQLCRSLEGQVQGNDEEGERAKRRESEISRACKALQEAQTELQRETAEVVRAHADIRNEMESCIASLRPASEWHPTVSGVARDTRQRCDAWLQRHAATATADAFAEARAIRDASVQAVERMKREEHELNGDFAQAEADFHALKALGAALAARAALDAFPWEVRLDQVDADRRRRARRDQWLGTLQVMEQDRADRARTAAATMVDDVDVRARFRRLIDQLQSVHPGLAGLDFRGSSVQAAGQDRGKSLSEGQRVLVNIAAAIAVVGKVLDAASHKPGWIVFDEPTNGLDEQGRRQVASYLGGLSSAEVPCQIVIATFDDQFASCLLEAADKSSRRWKHVALAPYVPGRLVVPVIRSRESA